MTLGVWVAPYREAPGAPEDRPMGRAALALEAEGVPVIFGHRAREGKLQGVRAVPGRWVPFEGPVAAVYDRFPSRSQPESWAALAAESEGVPRGNPGDIIALCADKLACQLALEGCPQPEVESDPARFAERLEGWGAGFLKPRFGAFGVGVRRVVPGDPLPGQVAGPLGALEPALLQRAVPPPRPFAGVACRVLVQREASGWWADVPVARTSTDDPVVNAARGAEVHPVADLFPDAAEPVRAVAVDVARRLAEGPSGPWVLELGVDVVLDHALQPWVVEVNARPRGRLESLLPLDPRWMTEHVRACARPLRALLRGCAPP